MNRDPTSASQALHNSKLELQRGHRQAARRWAEFAAAAAPELEEPWLILAALASPRASVAYLKRALQVSPQNGRARQGMRWAVQRLRQEEAKRSQPGGTTPEAQQGGITPAAQTQPGAPVKKKAKRGGTQAEGPARGGPLKIGHLDNFAEIQGQPPVIQGTNLESRRRSYLPLLLILACITVVLAVWPGNASPALAFIRQNISLPQVTPTLPGAAAEVLKPTYTPTFTPTFTPTPTVSPTPTPTDTSTPTPTFTPTSTPLPTDTLEPAPTYEPPTPVPIPGGDGERWIDVDLSQQSVYAYEGSVLVNSFIVSTGTWQHPTVTGQYYIYIKLLYSNMSGPGYYLPNVPYTMYFYKGYALHGTYWHHNFGTPMSHGCVNLSIPDAEWLYNFASVGTLVNIHY
jgi:lipoprotein-anchoring transpeptidase ErfK/SrfK